MLFTELFIAGGLFMYPLLIFSVVAIALIIERCIFWYKVTKRQRKVVRDVLADYQNNSDSLIQSCARMLIYPFPESSWKR